MELIETVRSSIIPLSLAMIILLLIAFGVYKVRNQAKKVNDSAPNQNKFKQVDSSPEKRDDLVKTDDINVSSMQVSKLQKQKFEVINDKIGLETLKEIRINYHSNVYKYYETTDSKKMFKLKVNKKDDK